MPIYEYRCQRCGKTFESWRPMSQSDQPDECPDCGAGAERILSAVGLGGAEAGAGGSCSPRGGFS